MIKINGNPNWLYNLGHPYRILITGGSRSGKTNALLNLIKHQQPDNDKKSYLYVKDSFKSKYQLLIKGRKKVGVKSFKKSKSIH